MRVCVRVSGKKCAWHEPKGEVADDQHECHQDTTTLYAPVTVFAKPRVLAWTINQYVCSFTYGTICLYVDYLHAYTFRNYTCSIFCQVFDILT